MKPVRTVIRREEIEFFLRLHGLWEGVTDIPPPPDPPYDIETMEPIPDPASWWHPADEPDEVAWQAPELPLDDRRILVLDGDPVPAAD